MGAIPLLVLFLNIYNVLCIYSPFGEDVQPGSVLLPATRRGRYLANIIRRQAVDGTGIKFNKDADRINAESKKKVDVLSEELLPYIIAEQERRTTLYKRVMTAIQNGEKGVTIAEIRNKPPLIIRKGLLYRCPSNRAPKEPDGSGTLMCEDNAEPKQIMYDSCLSAEDRELYVANNKYFFCNRHRVEGPDLPRNGSTVIGCAPTERTSFNYTTGKCALEDTDDVVVHYRYYPDRTYKFVTELDPDREVCEHWNPCQVGYIFSLPSLDQAIIANELWKDYVENDDEYERDEIVTPVPEDNKDEFVYFEFSKYDTSPRTVAIPDGFKYNRIIHVMPVTGEQVTLDEDHVTIKVNEKKKTVTIVLHFPDWSPSYEGTYKVEFQAIKGPGRTLPLLSYPFINLARTAISLATRYLDVLQGQKTKKITINYRCNRCRLLQVMIRAADGNFYNLDKSKYHWKEIYDRNGKPQQILEIELEGTRPCDFGDYFAVIQNSDGLEERIKALTVTSPERDTENIIHLLPLKASFELGGYFDLKMNYTCDNCNLTDILCNGESVLSAGRVSIVPVSKMISFNFPRFEDAQACVYMGFFKEKGKLFKEVLAVIEDSSPAVVIPKVEVVTAPKLGEQFETEVPFKCSDCSVEKVFVNGIPLDTSFEKTGPVAFFVSSPNEVIIRISEFVDTYEGIYQAVFNTGSENVTKTILEIRDPNTKKPDGGDGVTPESEKEEGNSEAAPEDGSTAAPDAGTTSGASAVPGTEGAASSAAPPDGTTAAPGATTAAPAATTAAPAATTAAG